MRRIEFIALLSGAVAWPIAARAQQPAIPVVGFLHSGSPTEYAHLVDAFQRGLNEAGFVEGRNVAIEFHWAEGQNDRLTILAADLVRRQVAVIAATGGPSPVLAAKAATSTIPVVFSTGVDPVKAGLVASLNQPGANITGVNVFTAVMEAKRLGFLQELVPSANLIAVLLNPNNPNVHNQVRDVQEAARVAGQKIQLFQASTDLDLASALETAAKTQAGGLLVGADPSFVNRRERIVALAARHAIPALYEQREFAAAGGLVSYGTSLIDAYRQVGLYVGRILKGEKPADLPVLQPTKFELVINLKTARTLRLEIPAKLLALADEVIE
jgi:putative ABC transport system substrate-binding protein